MKRSAPLRRHTPLAPVNRKRRQSEWQRAYGSKARVAFVKAMPCLVCGATPSENAHIETDGMGRKADADKIVPLCRAHHRRLHEMGRAGFEYHHWPLSLEAAADLTDFAWEKTIAAKRPAAAKTTKATKATGLAGRSTSGALTPTAARTAKKARTHHPTASAPAPRCELCGRHEVQAYGLCATCLTGKHRRSA